MESLLTMVYTKKYSIYDDTKDPSSNDDIKDKIEEQIVSIVEVGDRVFYLDEDENDKYKWYEIIDGEKVKRNNTDPTLTADGIPTIETQLRQIEEKDIASIKELSEEEKTKKENKNILMRIKCIVLDTMGKNILIDPKSLSLRERKEFIKRVEELLILSEEEIKIMFGNICHETIFQPGSDYSNYIVYDA
jgi:hypothetical protein